MRYVGEWMNSSAMAQGNSPRLLSLLLIVGCCAAGCGLQQERYVSPEAAAQALVAAVRSEDDEQVARVLGRGAKEVIRSGDQVADREALDRFLQAYDEKSAIVAEPDGSMTLQVGQDDWPMPIPIVERRGSWRFDTRGGKEEILNRRIGRNELSVREVCLAFVDAQREYISVDRNGDGVPEYAQKLISDVGQRNGLYWETAENEPPSPMGPLVAEAAEEGYGRQTAGEGQRRPYHGYYFKLLKSQGPHAPGGTKDYVVDGRMTEGFAVIAWPAEYGNSGIMTFLVSHQGVVYERDFGRRTDRLAPAITTFDPDPDWSVQ